MWTLPSLNYERNALEPVISANTLSYHHDKHHALYLENSLALIKDTEFADMGPEDILKDLSILPDDKKQAMINNIGGFYNHNLYFEQFGTEMISEKFLTLIERDFGTFDNFKTKMVEAGMAQFGSGWASLVSKNGELSIVKSANQDSPVSDGYKVLLTFDVWEHAYYLDFQNLRKKHLEELFYIVNWSVVESRY